MKCYVIKSGGSFIENAPRAIYQRYDYLKLNTIDDIDSAKHYKSKSVADRWLKNTLDLMRKNMVEHRKKHKRELNKPPTQYIRSRSYQLNVLQGRINAIKIIINWLSKASVDELDIETPSFMNKNTIRWCPHRIRMNTQSKGMMHIEQVTTGRWYCRSCGLQLKNVPFYKFDDGYGNFRVCIPCLKLRQDKIDAAFNSMDEDFRTNIINELILGSM